MKRNEETFQTVS